MTPSPSPKRAESSTDSGSISMCDYGSINEQQQLLKPSTSPKRSPQRSPTQHRSSLTSLTSLKDVSSRVAFLDSTKTHHHPHTNFDEYPLQQTSDEDNDEPPPDGKVFFSHTNLRKLALDLSLWINIFILVTKLIAYVETLSLSVLASLVDSILDVVSQFILLYTEKISSQTRSSAHYPSGASRLEPLGVLSCAALMGFASFGVLKEALEQLYEGVENGSMIMMDENWSSFWSMFSVVFVKLALWVSHVLCLSCAYHMNI